MGHHHDPLVAVAVGHHRNPLRRLSARKEKETWKVREEAYKYVHVIVHLQRPERLASEIVDSPSIVSNGLETGIEGEIGRESKTRTDKTHLFLPRRFDSQCPISRRVRQTLPHRPPPRPGKLETRKSGRAFCTSRARFVIWQI